MYAVGVETVTEIDLLRCAWKRGRGTIGIRDWHGLLDHPGELHCQGVVRIIQADRGIARNIRLELESARMF